MAIDSMLYACSIANGTTLAVGDVIPLALIRGPNVVRDGYGSAIMKRVFTCADTLTANGHVSVKNQNWIDELDNTVPQASTTALAVNSSSVQRCGDVELQPNSSFAVNYVVDAPITTTGAMDVFVLIDIEYPSVNAVRDPKTETGAPMSIVRRDNVNHTAVGSATTAVWTTYNVDIFKAGFRYLLAEMGFRSFAAGASLGFFSISGASGQNGLERIIPVVTSPSGALRYDIDYSTPLVKGPMNVNYLSMATAGGSSQVVTELDFIRR